MRPQTVEKGTKRASTHWSELLRILGRASTHFSAVSFDNTRLKAVDSNKQSRCSWDA
jgi:hypothetical protein